MSLLKPLVWNGSFEELQSSDYLSAPIAITLTAGENLTKGDIVYFSGANTVSKAKSNASSTMDAIGIATETINNTNSGIILLFGLIGGLSSLTAGAEYFVSDSSAGDITTTRPTTENYYIQKVGIAKSTTELIFSPSYSEVITASGGSGTAIINTFTAGESISKGQVVYLSSASTVSKAKSDSSSTMPAIGIANETKSSGNIQIVTFGELTGLTGLATKAELFVSDSSSGTLTATAPSSPGSFIQRVCSNLSTTAHFIDIHPMIEI